MNPVRKGKRMKEKNLENFEKKIGIKFKNRNLLTQAFVHRSYLNENVKFELDHNERLEFLGDAVMELIVTEYLFINYTNPEGELTNWRSALVKGETISMAARELSIGDYLFLSKGEEKSGGKARQLILANTFEAIIGAIYLDQGYEVVKKFIRKFLIVKLPEILENKLYMDAKSRFQEMAQAKFGITPQYKVLTEYGPDHAKSFSMGVYLDEKLYGEGSGSSKQNAEQAAAANALETFSE